MAKREVAQKEVDSLIEDALYLQDEAEALQYVIDSVPYDESPPGVRSISEMLQLIDHAQLSYYRPVLEQVIDSKRPTHLKNFTHFNETFDAGEKEQADIQKILRKIAKHRAGVVNLIKNTSLFDWEKEIYQNDEIITLFNFMRGMIHFERGVLKDIAERVKVFSQSKETQRELDKKRAHQKGQQFTENN